MTGVGGGWELVIETPIGRQTVVLSLVDRDGELSGVIRDLENGPEVALTDLTLDGGRLTWSQSITRPLRLNLTFDVTVDGDTMAGHAKAGRLPRSKVTGRRT
jgi:hypothetical protein